MASWTTAIVRYHSIERRFQVSDTPIRSCTCPGEDHPGPSPKKGRGAPEIDVFEAERNKTGGIGGIVSQSAQFAPFTHDYLYDDSTPDKHTIYNPEITVENTYKGSAVYVTVPSLFKLLQLIESITGSKPCRL